MLDAIFIFEIVNIKIESITATMKENIATVNQGEIVEMKLTIIPLAKNNATDRMITPPAKN